MTQADASPGFKPKKSVALSGTPAGNTELCTVGHTGNDLHYRGYDIHDLAANCEYEEVAYLLIHGKLPNTVELTAYKSTTGAFAQYSRGGEAGAGASAAFHAPHGCAAYSRVGARLHLSRGRRPQ